MFVVFGRGSKILISLEVGGVTSNYTQQWFLGSTLHCCAEAVSVATELLVALGALSVPIAGLSGQFHSPVAI